MSTGVTDLTAADVMHRDTVTVGVNDSLQDAMSLMTENHVTGLPVLDVEDRCVGVISATDILSFEQDHAEDSVDANAELARHFDPESGRWEDVRLTTFALEEFADVRVSEIMSHDIVAVTPATSLRDVAGSMTQNRVHRMLVLDEERQLLGVISAFDFVRLMADSD